ncbi:MAG: xanthine dehydrogenase family protein molybdopterin-binding subunit [Candidatus Binatia bacterium]
METKKYVGARIKRVEDKRFLRGSAKYVEDHNLPGMLHVAYVRSPHAHARIRNIDASAALAVPGVRRVFTGKDIYPAVKGMGVPVRSDAFPPEVSKHPLWTIMATTKARYVGEAVAAVIAESRYIAEDAAELVEVDYEVLPAVVDPHEAAKPGATLLHEDLGTNVIFRMSHQSGDVDAAFRDAACVIRERFQTNRHCALPMEGRATLATVDDDDNITLYSSTQNQFVARTRIAEVMGFPEHKLRVIAPDVGGGFGLKANVCPEETLACFFALKMKAPVRWIEDRREHLLNGFQSKDATLDCEMAFAKDGTILGLRSSVLGDIGAYNADPFPGTLEPVHMAVALPGPYRIRNYAFDVRAVCTNKVTLSTYRGVGQPSAVWSHERMMDLAARELGIDPAEIRKRNLLRADEFPCVSAAGLPYDSGQPLVGFEQALNTIDYAGFRQRQAEARKGGRYLGMGICTFIEMTSYGGSWAAAAGYEPTPWEAANVRMEPDGTVIVRVGTLSHGQGHYTTWAQVVADELGVPVEDVRIVQGDTHQTPYGWGSFGSRSAVGAGGALVGAASLVRQKMLGVAGHLMEVNPTDLELVPGEIRVKGIPSKSMSIREVARAGVWAIWRGLPEGQTPGLEATYNFDPPGLVFSNGTHIVEVEVDIETGHVKLGRYVIVEDCGRIINPLIVDGQVAGGVAQGIGTALYEHSQYDEAGQPLATTFMDYLVPTSTDVPHLEIGHLETPTPLTQQGFKGVGESGAIGAPAAVANAIADALAPFKPKATELPLTPERVWKLAHPNG